MITLATIFAIIILLSLIHFARKGFDFDKCDDWAQLGVVFAIVLGFFLTVLAIVIFCP
jgi:hypothetical protein